MIAVWYRLSAGICALSRERIMSNSHTTPISLEARKATSGDTARPKPELSSNRGPDAIVDEILQLLGQDRFRTARRLAAEAATRFPEHQRVQRVVRLFDTSSHAVRLPGNEPSRSEEFEWLRKLPEAVHGKWVALVGKKLVATADSLPELVKSLSSLTLPKTPLVHHID